MPQMTYRNIDIIHLTFLHRGNKSLVFVLSYPHSCTNIIDRIVYETDNSGNVGYSKIAFN
jgi:hypothetical protein